MMRVFMTLFLIGGSGMFYMNDHVEALVMGQTMGMQFDNSNASYLVMHSVQSGTHFLHWVFGFAVPFFLVLLWWAPMKRLFEPSKFAIAAILAGSMLTMVVGTPAHAYYSDSDYAETFMILPNESAFWLPDVGNNKDTQVKFGSEDYYSANKIAAKRFDVTTHIKLPNSGIMSNKYVSPGRLIKVDRSPVTREWVKASHRGTGKDDQSFPCQSMEGLDVTTGVSIGTSVAEENAPKFLYNFGVNTPKGDPNDPNVVFTSVYYGKSLAQVMDEKVRNRVQSLVCDEMTKHKLNDANAKAADIMKSIETQVKTYLTGVGITLDFIGWADTFEFSHEVQAAIDRNYIADVDTVIALKMAPHVDTLKGLATAEAIRKVGDKWNGVVPSSVSLWWLPDSVSNLAAKLFAPTGGK